jgi:hypothetical protein
MEVVLGEIAGVQPSPETLLDAQHAEGSGAIRRDLGPHRVVEHEVLDPAGRSLDDVGGAHDLAAVLTAEGKPQSPALDCFTQRLPAL